MIPALVVCLLWIPFGFSLHGLIEEWGVLGMFAAQHLFFIADAHSPLPAHALRPLTVFPQAVGYFLDSNSFTFWHLQLMLTLVLKGAATGYLVWRASGRRSLAVLASALVLVYPADTMQLAFRSVHINMALALVLLAACACVAAYRADGRRQALIAAFVGAVLFASACSMYETALPLFPLPWFVLFCSQGWASIRFVIRRWAIGVIWFGGLVAYLLYVWYASTQIQSYQSSLAGGKDVLIASLPNLFRVGAAHGLIGGWVEAYAIVIHEYASYVYLALSAAVLFVAVGMSARLLRDKVAASPAGVTPPVGNEAPDAGMGPLVRLIAAGFVLTLLGYAPYLMSPAHQVISQRTFLFATPGAAMVWVGIIAMAASVLRPAAVALSALMLSLGLGMQLYQFHHYVRISMEQDRIVRTIVDAMGPLPANKTVVVLDGTNIAGQTWMHLTASLTSALTYFYGRGPAGVEICRMPAGEWQPIDGLGRKGSCILDATSVRFRVPAPVSGPGFPTPAAVPDRVLARENVVLISIDADGNARALPRDAAGTPVLEGRYRGVLAADTVPWGEGMFRESALPNAINRPFGKYWSLEVPLRSVGWREPEWRVGWMKKYAVAWKVDPVATLYVDMAPSQRPYVLKGSLGPVARADTRETLAIRVNAMPLKVVWDDPSHFHAEVPGGTLHRGRNAVDFESPVASDYFGFSFVLERFSMEQTK